jgi:hypothetical protein
VRLDVAVDEVVLEGVLQPQGGLADALGGAARLQHTGQADHLGQVGALVEVHGAVKGAGGEVGVAELDDVGVVEPGHGLHFLQELRARLGVRRQLVADDLEGDDPVVFAVPGLVHQALAALAEAVQDVVRPQRQVGAVVGQQLVHLVDRQPALLDQMARQRARVAAAPLDQVRQLVQLVPGQHLEAP